MSSRTKPNKKVSQAVISPRGLRPQWGLAHPRHENEATTSADRLSDATHEASGSAHDFGQIRVHPDQDNNSRAARPAAVQAKLTIGQPNDLYEQEADRVADLVMHMPEPRVQRQVSPEEKGEERRPQAEPLTDQITHLIQRQVEPENEEETVQMKRVHEPRHQVGPVLATRIRSLKGQGQPLAAAERNFFEPRFGRDFSYVRVHTDAQATELARAINARALTFGDNIAFGTGEFTPETTSGKWIIAHELAHVIQQGYGVNIGGTIQRKPPKLPFSPPLREPPKAAPLPGQAGGTGTPPPVYQDIQELADAVIMSLDNRSAKFVFKFKQPGKKDIRTRWGLFDVNLEGTLFKGEISAPKGRETAKVEMSQDARVKFRQSLSNIFGLPISDIEIHQEVGGGVLGVGARVRKKFKVLEGEGLTHWQVRVIPEFGIEFKHEAGKGIKPLVFKARFEGVRDYEYGSGHVFKAGWELDLVLKCLPNLAAIARDIISVARAATRGVRRVGVGVARAGRLGIAAAQTLSVAATGAEVSSLGTLAAVAEAGGLVTIMFLVPIASFIELTYGKEKAKVAALQIGYRNRAFSYRLAVAVFKTSDNLEAFEKLLSDPEGGVYAAQGVLAAEALLSDTSEEQLEQLRKNYEGERGFTHFWDKLTSVMTARQLGTPISLPTTIAEVIKWNSH